MMAKRGISRIGRQGVAELIDPSHEEASLEQRRGNHAPMLAWYVLHVLPNNPKLHIDQMELDEMEMEIALFRAEEV